MNTVICFATHCSTYQTWVSEHIPDGEVEKAVMAAFLPCKICGGQVTEFEWKKIKEKTNDDSDQNTRPL